MSSKVEKFDIIKHNLHSFEFVRVNLDFILDSLKS